MTGKYEHIFISGIEAVYPFRSRRQRGNKNYPQRNRTRHGKWLYEQFQKAWTEAKKINNEREAISLPTKNGVYLEFSSTPEYELAIRSLENVRSGIRLMNVRTTQNENGENVRIATVYVPNGKQGFFLKKIQEYIEKNTKKGNPKHKDLVESIENIRLAVVESFWPYHDVASIPDNEPKWCEIWLNTDNDSDEAQFRTLASRLKIELRQETLRFPERRVILAKVNRENIEELIKSSDNIAEFRRADEITSFFVDLDNATQSELAKELLNRVSVEEDSEVSVCILDTGVNNGHILIASLLRDEDCYSYRKEWGTHDHDGHGTKMSGIVGYGDLQVLLENSEPVKINHLLESVKIIPPSGKNEPHLYGAITAQSISRVMIENPERKRIICMAITAPEYTTGDGRPSSWSAALDELASGFIDEQQKLIIVSAGNIRDPNDWKNYPEINKLKSVENPAQSWNALTVGAYTEKSLRDLKSYKDCQTVAPRGGLSPYSTTSVLWDNKWPIKPDIVLEGGNVLKDKIGCFQCEDLSVLTTHYKPLNRQFDTIWATSAATAKAAWMAAQIQAKYPNAWPETIRGLLVHSADWTDTMKKQFLQGKRKSDFRELLRICGYGVPNLERALWSMQNSVNLIIQAELQPFDKKGDRYVTKEMHLYELPWPKEVLLSLGEMDVSMRVTLSYFIEPSPGEIGWKERYRYASCGLRFDVNGADTKDVFLRRINAAMQSDEDIPSSTSANWLLGSQNRHLGSIHSDVWQGTAAELALSNMIGVYPVIGWWRERHWLKRWDKKVRYSLIVSLQTPEQSVDLYTPIITEISSKVPIAQ